MNTISQTFASRQNRLDIQKQRHPFTLIELLVVIAISAVLMALLLPMLNMAREQGRSIFCQNNLKQFGLAFSGYTDDNNGYYPHTAWDMEKTINPPVRNIYFWNWAVAMARGRYVGGNKVWRCPTAEGMFNAASNKSDWGNAGMLPPTKTSPLMYVHYGYNSLFVGQRRYAMDGADTEANKIPAKTSEMKKVTTCMILTDSIQGNVPGFSGSCNIGYYGTNAHALHGGASKTAGTTIRFDVDPKDSGYGNILWADGHVARLKNSRYELNYNGSSVLRELHRKYYTWR